MNEGVALLANLLYSLKYFNGVNKIMYNDKFKAYCVEFSCLYVNNYEIDHDVSLVCALWERTISKFVVCHSGGGSLDCIRDETEV